MPLTKGAVVDVKAMVARDQLPGERIVDVQDGSDVRVCVDNLMTTVTSLQDIKVQGVQGELEGSIRNALETKRTAQALSTHFLPPAAVLLILLAGVLCEICVAWVSENQVWQHSCSDVSVACGVAIAHLWMIIPLALALGTFCALTRQAVLQRFFKVGMASRLHRSGLPPELKGRFRESCKLYAGAFVFVAMRQCKLAATASLEPEAATFILNYLELGQALLQTYFINYPLDLLLVALDHFRQQDNDMYSSNKAMARWKRIMESVCAFRSSDENAVYSFSERKTPIDVLHKALGILVIVCKVLIYGMVLLQYAGYLNTGSISYVITFGLFFGLSGFIMPHLVAIAIIVINRPFYLGDICTFTPSHCYTPNPTRAVTGFIENVTLSHVVIRDFTNKQNWVPVLEARSMVVVNWTRRPTYTVRIWLSMAASAPAEGVKALMRFARRWIDTCPCVFTIFLICDIGCDVLGGPGDGLPTAALHNLQAFVCIHQEAHSPPFNIGVNQHGYKKSCIGSVAAGYQAELIFMMKSGADRDEVRSEFILVCFAAAQRLGVPIVPEALMENFKDPGPGLDVPYEPKGFQPSATSERAEFHTEIAPIGDTLPANPSYDELLTDLVCFTDPKWKAWLYE